MRGTCPLPCVLVHIASVREISRNAFPRTRGRPRVIIVVISRFGARFGLNARARHPLGGGEVPGDRVKEDEDESMVGWRFGELWGNKGPLLRTPDECSLFQSSVHVEQRPARVFVP